MEERRLHPRAWSLLGRARVAARLRTGSPLRVLNTSPDGLLVESPARLAPGRQVELMLHSGTSWEQAPWVVIHSRVVLVASDNNFPFSRGRSRGRGGDRSGPLAADDTELALVRLGTPLDADRRLLPAAGR